MSTQLPSGWRLESGLSGEIVRFLRADRMCLYLDMPATIASGEMTWNVVAQGYLGAVPMRSPFQAPTFVDAMRRVDEAMPLPDWAPRD